MGFHSHNDLQSELFQFLLLPYFIYFTEAVLLEFFCWSFHEKGISGSIYSFVKYCLAIKWLYLEVFLNDSFFHIHQIKNLEIFLLVVFGAKSPKRDATFNLGFDLSPESLRIALSTHRPYSHPLPPLGCPRFRNGGAKPRRGVAPKRTALPLPSWDLNSLALLFISDLANQAAAVGHALGQKFFQVLL